MRAGACAVQQTLTSEAASVLKHSLSLARRRGHAQVTPLHVAAILLSARVSLLRRACLKSQPHQASHPLQCRALELCFNVALNRLPTIPGPLLHGQPSLSNALIAALKRAQAHQRRGCIEHQQQQPLLAVKVELEQLILSILDDPSVSRVMREAGFSSTAVKNSLEDSSVSSVFQCYNSSGGIYSTPNSPPEAQREIINPTSFWHSHLSTYTSEQNALLFSPQKKVSSNPITDISSVKEDIKLVVEVLLRKKRKNTVIVGDSSSITEGVVAELMGKVERGDVPDELKSVHFIKFQFTAAPLRFMKKEEVELNISDLKRKVESLASVGAGVIIYTGDLKWTVDSAFGEKEGDYSINEVSGYSPVDHLVAEIGRLISFYSSTNTRVWLMATANYQTYMKCQMKQPPLDIKWALQAVSVPSGGLGLSLNATSVHDSRITFSRTPSQLLMMGKKPFFSKEEQDVLTCCAECTSNYEKEAALKSNQQKPSLYPNSCNTKDEGSSQLPYWLKKHDSDASEKDDLVELRRKWNRLCQNLHQGRHNQNHISSVFSNQCSLGKNYSYNSSNPWWSNQNSVLSESKSISFGDPSLKPNQTASSVPKFRRQQSCHIEFSFSNGSSKHQATEPNLDSLKSRDDKEVKITLALGNSEFSDGLNMAESNIKKATRNADICKLLQENVPWQSENFPSILEALVDSHPLKKDTWLLIEGNDIIGKRRLARGLAEAMFGSDDLLFCMSMRKRETMLSNCAEMLDKALKNHDKLLVLLEDIDLADVEFLRYLADAFANGFGRSSNKDGDACQAIFILTKSNPGSYDRGETCKNSVMQMKLVVSTMTNNSVTVNIDHKRKAEWDLPKKSKSPRNDEMEDVSSFVPEKGKKEFTRQLSSNTLDLNIKADEDEENDVKPQELSSLQSTFTSENQQNPLGFLDMIKNTFVFKRNSAKDGQMRDMFLSMIKVSFEEVYGSNIMSCFTVDQMVLEGLSLCSGSFLNSLFEKWLKDIFQTSLQTVDIGRKENICIRLCLAGKGGGGIEDSFMSSCLPKGIQVSFLD